MLLGGVGRWKEQVQGWHWQKTEGDEQRRFQRLPNERLQLSVDDSELPISSFSIYIYMYVGDPHLSLPTLDGLGYARTWLLRYWP